MTDPAASGRGIRQGFSFKNVASYGELNPLVGLVLFLTEYGFYFIQKIGVFTMQFNTSNKKVPKEVPVGGFLASGNQQHFVENHCQNGGKRESRDAGNENRFYDEYKKRSP